MKTSSIIRSVAVGALLAAGAIAAPANAQETIYFSNNAYRTGPFSGSGIPIGDGMRDYISMINERDGGVNGVKIVYEECETGYDTKKSIECYEQVKSKTIVYSPWSTGATRVGRAAARSGGDVGCCWLLTRADSIRAGHFLAAPSSCRRANGGLRVAAPPAHRANGG